MERDKNSDSVFQDLGFSPEQAENLRVRSELALMIRRYIEATPLTQSAAAKMFGVTQPRLSDLLRGRIHLFRIDALVSMLAYAGVPVTIVPLPKLSNHPIVARSETQASLLSREVTGRSPLLEDFSRPVGIAFSSTECNHRAGETRIAFAA